MVVGASKDDPYYKMAKENNVKIIPPVENSLLPKYYSASDIYVLYGSKNAIKHNGMGVAPAEALACNIPVVSTNLQNLNKENIKKVGKLVNGEKDMEMKIIKVIDNIKQYKNCRKIAKETFSVNKVIKEGYLNIYKALLLFFYNSYIVLYCL
jgi:glycosyltransferase involved in cell wall biosynthesis